MPETDKPNGVPFGWQCLATDYPYTHHMFRVRRDQVRWPDGHVAPYVYVQSTGAVWVVPVTADGQVVLNASFATRWTTGAGRSSPGASTISLAALSTWQSRNWPRR